MEKPILLVDFGRLMADQLRNAIDINKKTFILDEYIVDAIPKDWIVCWLNRTNRHYCDVDLMLEDWEKENEESN